MSATELLASCVVDVPDCEDNPSSGIELPFLLAILAVLLLIGVASALGLRDASSSRARRRSQRARTPEIRSAEPDDRRYDTAGEPELRS